MASALLAAWLVFGAPQAPERSAEQAPQRPATPPPQPVAAQPTAATRRVIVRPTLAVEPLPIVAGPAQQISARELEAHEYDDIHRVLTGVPGVYVRNEDGFGLRPNIGMRGVNPERSAKITLMEDGIPIAPAPYSAPAVFQAPLATRMVGVDIVKGPAALRFGPRTIAGAVDLHARAIPDRPTAFVDVAGGRFGYGKLHAVLGTSYRGFGVMLELARLQSNGFKQIDGGGNSGFRANDATLALSYQRRTRNGVRHRLETRLGYADELSNETYLGLSLADFLHTPYRRYAASARDRFRLWRSSAVLAYVAGTDTLELDLRLYRRDHHRVWYRVDRFRDGPSLASLLLAPDDEPLQQLLAVLRGDVDSRGPGQSLLTTRNDWRYVSQGVQPTLRWRPRWRSVAQQLEIGARVHGDSIVRHDTEDAWLMHAGRMVPEGSPSVDALRNHGAALAAAFHVFDAITIRDRITIAPALRVEVIGMRFRDGLAGTRTRRTDVPVSPGLGALVRATQWLSAFAGVHRGFSPVFPGQPKSVVPERSVNYEAGLRALREALLAEAAGFVNDYQNLNGTCSFGPDCAGGSDNRQFNAGKVWIWGFEGLLRWRQAVGRRGLHVEAGGQYTYTKSRLRHSFHSDFGQWGDVERGDELPYLPRHVAGGLVAMGGRIWDASLSPSYAGAMRDVAGQGPIPLERRIDGFFVLDASAEVRLLGRLRLYAQIGNLTNAVYVVSQRPFGLRPGAPLTAMAGLVLHGF